MQVVKELRQEAASQKRQIFHSKNKCDTGQSGKMQSVAAVALSPLLFFLLRTPQQRLKMLFNRPYNSQNAYSS